MDVPRETASSATELFGAGLATAQAYADALATTGVERGLIGPREVPRLWERHLLNCVALKELIPVGAKLADVGSGAGLPGLPLAIARSDLSVSLVEPLLRRVVWLREVVPSLGLPNVEVLRGRANAVVESGERFDVVTARAVLPLSGLLALCLPLLRPGGELLAMKGDSADEELLLARDVLKEFRAAEWAVMLCGEGVLATPTKVVRVVASRASTGQPSGLAWSGEKAGMGAGAAQGAAKGKDSRAARPASAARSATGSNGRPTRAGSVKPPRRRP